MTVEKAIYDDIRFVHDMFGKKPNGSSDEGDDDHDRDLMAFSDCLVFAYPLRSSLTDIMGMFDAFMFDLSTIGLAQAECACNGIFLRGAITIGPWFRDPDRDIVVSTALADAYNMERTAVGEPVIGVHEDVFRLFEKTHGRKSYAKAADPFDSVLTTGRRKDGATIRFIHYLDSGLDGAASWNSDEDLKHYKAEHDEVKKRRIMSDSYTRNQKRFLLSHAQSIHNGLLAAPAVAKGKYEWLIDYHNKCVMDLGDQFSDCFIKSVT